MTEVQVNVSVDDLYKQLGQMHVVIAQLRDQNKALNDLASRLNDRIRQLEAEKASLLDSEGVPVG